MINDFQVLPRAISRHSGNAAIATTGCHAMNDLASLNTHSAKLGAEQAPAALVAALVAHGDTVDIVLTGLVCAGQLFDCDANVPKLRAAGLCAFIVRALYVSRKHSSKRLTLVAFGLIARFCADDACRNQFATDARAAETVVETLFGYSNDFDVSLLGCTVIASFCGLTPLLSNRPKLSSEENVSLAQTQSDQGNEPANNLTEASSSSTEPVPSLSRRGDDFENQVDNLGEISLSMKDELVGWVLDATSATDACVTLGKRFAVWGRSIMSLFSYFVASGWEKRERVCSWKSSCESTFLH